MPALKGHANFDRVVEMQVLGTGQSRDVEFSCD